MGGGEIPLKPLYHAAPGPRPYKLQVRNLRNLVIQAFPATSRTLTHLKLGLFWAFAGDRFWEEMPTLAFLSTEQVNLPAPR